MNTKSIPMSRELAALLEQLDREGTENDLHVSERSRKWLSITPDTGAFLWVLVSAIGARRVLEIGTSRGYSTLWLASAVSAAGGRVTTVEISPEKIAAASANFARSGLNPLIAPIKANASELLKCSSSEAYDLIFLDSERVEYAGWWPNLKRVLRYGGLLVVDNAISHAAEVTPLISLVRAEGDYGISLVPVGKGVLLFHKPGR